MPTESHETWYFDRNGHSVGPATPEGVNSNVVTGPSKAAATDPFVARGAPNNVLVSQDEGRKSPPVVQITNPYAKVSSQKASSVMASENSVEEDVDDEKNDDALMDEFNKQNGLVADKTIEGYSTAAAAFNIFAKKKGYPLLHEIQAKHLSGAVRGVPSLDKLFVEFCFFLLSFKIEKPGKRQGKHLMPGSQAQYLSGVKTVLSKKFPKHPYFQELSTYNDLYARLKMRARVTAIKNGQSPEEKTIGLHRDILEKINHQLISESRFLDRAVVNSLYTAVGRSSEVATWTWEATEWNPRQEQLEGDWRETIK